MVKKRKLLLYNFPQCSMLKNELILNIDSENFSTKSCGSLLRLVDEVKEDKSSELLIFSDQLGEFEKLLEDLKTLKNETDISLSSTLIFPELDKTEKKKFSKYGVDKFFTPDDHSIDITEYIEGKLKKSNPTTDDKIVISAKAEPKEATLSEVSVEVSQDAEHYEEIKANILENTDAKNIILESGTLDVSMRTASFPNIECELEDFSNQDIEVEVLSVYQPQINEIIEIKVIFAYVRCKVELMLSGEVKDCYESTAGKAIIAIRLSEDETENLNNFMALYQKRQKSIDEFITLARGR